MEHITPLYDNTVKDTLEVLRGAGYTMSILSNTGLTAGRTLERVLKAHDIAHLFDFKLYSDEIQTAKPNTKAFQLVYEYAKQLYDNHITPEEIMHVGDNIKADIE